LLQGLAACREDSTVNRQEETAEFAVTGTQDIECDEVGWCVVVEVYLFKLEF